MHLACLLMRNGDASDGIFCVCVCIGQDWMPIFGSSLKAAIPLKVLSRIAGLFPTDRMGVISFHFAVLIYCVLSQLYPEDSKMQLLVSFGFLEIGLFQDA